MIFFTGVDVCLMEGLVVYAAGTRCQTAHPS
jgi:hypothetical protein